MSDDFESENSEDARPSLRVRPYLVTGGRTKSAIELPLEALVLTTPAGLAALDGMHHERHFIVDLCRERQSLAEISAHAKIHLQVAKVLVGDLITEGLLGSHTATVSSSARPDVQLLERVLDGLQAL